MLRESISELQAVARSAKFAAFADGVPVQLPTGETITLKIRSVERSLRPDGLRFSKFAFITEVTGGEVVGHGFGEAETRMVALQKSISEGVERAIFRALKQTPFGTPNSNGWAAHIDKRLADESALAELLERDAVLVHWLCEVPMDEIAPESWPDRITRWSRKEFQRSSTFKRLRILVSTQGHLPALTTVLESHDGHAVLSHATSSSVEVALEKALAETCRIAQLGTEGAFKESSLRLTQPNSEEKPFPEDHVLLYAHHEKLPPWLFGRTSGWKAVAGNWRKAHMDFRPESICPKFLHVQAGPLIVSRCTSQNIQSLYFGRTEHASKQGLLNIRRLRRVKPEGEFNPRPHCIA